MRPSIPAALTVLLATASLAACGGVDKKAYVDEVTGVQQNTALAASTLSDDMENATTAPAVADKLVTLSKEVKENSVNLDAIEAPKQVQELHQEYVDLMAKFSTDLSGLAEQVRKADPDAANKLLLQASQITSKLAGNEQRIVQSINDELRS